MRLTPTRPFRVCAGALLILTITAATAACASKHETFSNPIEPVGQDPYVTQWRSRYLLIEEREDNELWVEVSRPRDLTGVSERGHAYRIWRAPARGSACTDLWAPELHHIGSRWYVYYSATTCDGNNANHRDHVLESTSDNPVGAYTDRGEITDPSNKWSIDGTELTVGTDRYFVWSGWSTTRPGAQNLYIATMSDPTTISSPRHLLATPTLRWEQHGAPIEEGPEALSHAGRTFLIYSASGSWTNSYCYGMLTLTGPDPLQARDWQKATQPVFATANGVYGPGHGSFVTSPDGTQPWMIYHSAIAEGSGWDRQIDAQPFTWNLNGTPNFGTPISENTSQPVPAGQR